MIPQAHEMAESQDAPPSLDEPCRSAREAGRRWAERDARGRMAILKRFRHRAAAMIADLVTLASPHHHGPGAAAAAEIMPLLDACRWLEREAPRRLAPRRLGRHGRPFWLAGIRTRVLREALGVVLVVGPGNYPMFLPGVQVLQALAAGNAVLVKPAPGCEAAMTRLRELLVEAGLPAELFHVVPSDESSVVAALEGGVDKVVVTGSETTGRIVLEQCARHLVPATMELSGCDPVWVLPGADPDLVVRALAFGLGLNGGRTCIAPRRVLVAAPELGALEARLRASIRSARPVSIEPRVCARLDPILEAIAAEGGSVVRPEAATASEGPLLIIGGGADRIERSDLFAPWLTLRTVDPEAGLAEELERPLALGATVFGENEAAEAWAERLPGGIVCVNDMVVPTADPRIPFGGRRRSGFGVTRGAEGLLEMTAPKVIAVRRRGRLRHLEPAEPEDEALLQGFARIAHEKGAARRWRALRQVVDAARRRGRGTRANEETES